MVFVTSKNTGRTFASVTSKLNRANNLIAPYRTWIARGLLGASLMARVPSQVKMIAKHATEFVNETIDNVKQLLPQKLLDAMSQLATIASHWSVWNWVIPILGGAMVLVSLAQLFSLTIRLFVRLGYSVPYGELEFLCTRHRK